MCNKVRQAMDKGWVIHNNLFKKENEKQIQDVYKHLYT